MEHESHFVLNREASGRKLTADAADRRRCVRWPFCYIGTVMPYPSDSEGLKGLARVTFRNTVPYEGTGETAPAPGEDLPALPPYRQWEAANPTEAARIRARERQARQSG